MSKFGSVLTTMDMCHRT